MWFALSFSDMQTQSIKKKKEESGHSAPGPIKSPFKGASVMHVHAYQLTDFLRIDTSRSQPSRLRCLPTTSFIPACAVREIRVTLNEWSRIRYLPPPRATKFPGFQGLSGAAH